MDMFHISCMASLLFIIVPVLESRVHSLSLFSYQTFNFAFENVAFTRITMCTGQELSPQISIAKNVNTGFVNTTLCSLFFFRSGLRRSVKECSNRKQVDAQIQVTMKCAPTQSRTDEKMF